MAKYFVHAGLQFQTVELLPAELNASGTMRVDAVTLESVRDNLSELITGADDAAKMTTLRGWWTEPGTLTDLFQRVSRQTLNDSGALVMGTLQGLGESTMNNFHRRSHEYILPPHLSEGITTIPLADSDDTKTDSRLRILVESLQIRHTNIIKHNDAPAAWKAWNAYIVTEEASEEHALARQGYFVMPPMTGAD